MIVLALLPAAEWGIPQIFTDTLSFIPCLCWRAVDKTRETHFLCKTKTSSSLSPVFLAQITRSNCGKRKAQRCNYFLRGPRLLVCMITGLCGGLFTALLSTGERGLKMATIQRIRRSMEQGWAGSDVKLATLSGADRGFPMILIIADSDIQWRLVSLVSDGHGASAAISAWRLARPVSSWWARGHVVIICRVQGSVCDPPVMGESLPCFIWLDPKFNETFLIG